MSLPTTRLGIAGAALALAVAGCTAAPAPTPTPTETPAASQSATVTAAPSTPAASPSAGSSITLGAPAPSPTATAAPGGVQSPSLVTALPGSTVSLDLTNAFHADGWVAGLYQPAGVPSKVPALATTANCGQPGTEIEYRFAPTGGNIKVTVAQDLLSDSSDNTVLFQLVADGRAVTEKPGTFTQTAELTAPLNGVTVVKIVAVTQGTCRSSSTALVTRAVVQG